MASEISILSQDLWSVAAGFRNGVHYGVKIRFPHALVMTTLFGRGTLAQRARSILTATYTHAKNLGGFVVIFKLTRLLLKYFRQKEDSFNTFVGGLIGGAIMFGDNTPITSQINMYIMSRVIFGLGRTLTNAKLIEYKPWMFTLFGAVSWGLVMYLYYHEKNVLQGSLTASMNYIYGDTDKAPITNLWTLLTKGIY